MSRAGGNPLRRTIAVLAVVATLVLLISQARGDPGEERLVLLGTYHSIGHGFDVEGDFAYVGTSHGIEIYNVTRTSNVRPIERHHMDQPMMDVVLDGSLLYATSSWYGVYVFDVSNPYNVTEVSHTYWHGHGSSTFRGIERFDDFLCVGTFNDTGAEIAILDVSDPNNLTLVSTLPYDRFVTDCEYWNGYLYVLAGFEGLRVLDVSDPYNPQEVGHLDTEGIPREIAFHGNTAFVADYDGGLLILDMSDPLNPADTWYRYEYGAKVYSVFPTDELLFVGDQHGLRVYDRTSQGQIIEREFYNYSGSPIGGWEVNDIEVIGSRVYTMDGGFSIFEFQEPEYYIPIELPFFLLPAAFAAVVVAALWWRSRKGGEIIPPKRL
ncbi:MAG: hypothetical protein LN415_09620 [Candidatus Thermoplasmatota archaeon]|nr:hypothetical protein [Candidatus Thermoplasmatota archaeon]